MATSNLTAVNLTNQANSTLNGNECHNLLFKYVGLTLLLLIIYSTAIIIGMIGNLLIIYIVIKKKSLRTSTNLFLVNMAVGGIGIVCFLIPKKVSEVFTGQYVWVISGSAGQVLCKIVPFIHDVFVDCSTYSLILITLDRLIVVVYPRKRWLASRRVVNGLIVCTWLASIIINAILIKKFNILYHNNIMYCAPLWDSRGQFLSYICTFIVLNIVFPLIFIPIAYAKIFRKLKKQLMILADSISNQHKLQDSLRQKKIVYMAFCIVCCFSICWAPFALQFILQYTVYLDHVTLPCPFLRFREVSFYFLVLISVTNPAICFKFNTAFTEELKEIYRRVCPCKTQVAQIETLSTNIELNKATMENNGPQTPVNLRDESKI